MSKSNVVEVKRGRPEQYGVGYIRAFKTVVRKHGLLKGREVINAEGLKVNGTVRTVSISLPTLSKYVKKANVGGNPVELKQGRPKSKAA